MKTKKCIKINSVKYVYVWVASKPKMQMTVQEEYILEAISSICGESDENWGQVKSTQKS